MTRTESSSKPSRSSIEGGFLGLVGFSVVIFNPGDVVEELPDEPGELVVAIPDPVPVVTGIGVSDSRLAFALANAAVILRKDNSIKGLSDLCRVE